MLEEKIKQYAYYILFLSLSFQILNLAGLSDMHVTVAGFDINAAITQDVQDIQDRFLTASNSIDYALAAGFLLVQGAKILIEMFTLITLGILPLMDVMLGTGFGIPAVIYTPIVAVMIAIALYDMAKILLRIV